MSEPRVSTTDKRRVILADMRAKLDEAKRLISASRLDATTIGRLRMMIWQAEQMIAEMEREP